MKAEMIHQSDEQQIRQIIESQHDALSSKDAAGAIAPYAKGNVMYTMAPPLRSQNDDEASATDAVNKWLNTWESGPNFETRDLSVTAAGDLAYSTGLVHMTGDQKGKRTDQWYRRTVVFQRIDGQWKIVHDHESVPFYMDGSFKAAIDLKPE
jgi:PhnB protein